MKFEIYLDNNTTTRPSDKAVAAMIPFLTDRWGSPSAPHQRGQELLPAMAESLKLIYALLGGKYEDDFVFTSSGAEAVNQVVYSTYEEVTRSTGKNQFITSKADEASSLMAISHLERMGCVAKLVDVDRAGLVTADAVADMMTPRTVLVSLSWANGLTGVVNPVQEIAELCKARGVLLHLDATHVLGKLYYDLDEIGASYITFNGDNIHAPKGTGGLLIRDKAKCGPLIRGGLEQAGRRAGSINIPGLAALGSAAVEALESRDYFCTEVARLRNKLETGICGACPGAEVLFQEQERLPHCTTITFPGVVNEALLYLLNRKGVYACIGGGSFQQIALVLTAAGVDPKLANSAISFSLSRDTHEDGIDRAVLIIKDAYCQLQAISVT